MRQGAGFLYWTVLTAQSMVLRCPSLAVWFIERTSGRLLVFCDVHEGTRFAGPRQSTRSA